MKKLLLIAVAIVSSMTVRADDGGNLHRFIQRTMPESVRETPSDTLGHFALPKPYSVPCVRGAFQDMYYWDTYFTNVGLIADGNLQQARNNIECIAAMIERFGFMPNASAEEMLTRSQPPYFCPMVDDYFQATADTAFVKAMMPVIAKEYDFWMTKRIAPDGLNRYGHQASDEYLTYFFNALAPRVSIDPSSPFTAEERIQKGAHLLAEAESGWDFNARFEDRCMDYNPVDLNSLLYYYEKSMAEFNSLLGLNPESDRWLTLSEKRKGLMTQLMTDSCGVLRDYDFVNNHLSPILSAASFMPLWVGMATPEQAVAAYSVLPRLEAPHGLRVTELSPRRASFQWDLSNDWSALHYTTVSALDRYGYVEAADRLANKYMESQEKIFAETGQLWEKYNAEDGTVNVVDEYRMPGDFMGWTAGVYSAFFRRPFCVNPYTGEVEDFETAPALKIFRPNNPVGTVVLICPGGGYSIVASKHEGVQWAEWFNRRGITVAVLNYRLPHRNDTIPAEDACAAIRYLRSNAENLSVDSTSVGIMGFSAGGHLASTVATHFSSPLDRPDFQILFYPVITMDPDFTHWATRSELISDTPAPQKQKYYSNELQVSPLTPPAWIVCCEDDNGVPPANSLRYFEALMAAGVPAYLHIFPTSGHGFGYNRTFPYREEMLKSLDSFLSKSEWLTTALNMIAWHDGRQLVCEF